MKRRHLFYLAAIGCGFPAMAADAPAVISVIQKDQAFSQPVVTLHVGDTIMWGNADDVDHNVTVVGVGTETDHGVQKPGHVIKQTFDAPGSYRVICHIHPHMKMTVVAE